MISWFELNEEEEVMELDNQIEKSESEDAYVVLELKDYEMLNTQLFTPNSKYRISVLSHHN